jgi:hypothetical protein
MVGPVIPKQFLPAKGLALAPFIYYLRDLLLRIPTHPNKAIGQLLSDHCKRYILPILDTPPKL